MLKPFFLGLVFAAASVTGAAQAAIIDVSYMGLITDGLDSGGTFAATGTDLTGDTIKVDYLFDTTLGGYYSSPTSTSYVSDATHASPAVSATITIAGISVTFDGDAYGVIAGTNTAAYSSASHEADALDGSFVYSSVIADAGLLPASVLRGYTYTVQANDNTTGYFQLASGSYGSFTPTNIVSTVPLPASLPMFASGLIGLGIFRKVQKRAVAGSAEV